MNTNTPLSIGFVTDEIDPDLTEALGIGLSWGIQLYELRMARSGRVPFFDAVDHAVVQRARENLGVRFTAVSPGLFKVPVTAADDIERQLEDVLPITAHLARAWDVPVVIVFGFARSETDGPDAPMQAAALLRRAAEIASEYGVALAVENEPGFHCDSGTNTARILRHADHPALRANWDPANAVGTGEDPYPAGYRALLPFITNVHVKDTREGSLVRCVPVGEGMIDWREQLSALSLDRPVSHVTIETHCLPLRGMSRKNLDTVRALMTREHEA